MGKIKLLCIDPDSLITEVTRGDVKGEEWILEWHPVWESRRKGFSIFALFLSLLLDQQLIIYFNQQIKLNSSS